MTLPDLDAVHDVFHICRSCREDVPHLSLHLLRECQKRGVKATHQARIVACFLSDKFLHDSGTMNVRVPKTNGRIEAHFLELESFLLSTLSFSLNHKTRIDKAYEEFGLSKRVNRLCIESQFLFEGDEEALVWMRERLSPPLEGTRKRTRLE